jgi:antitoxin (DNA-binding transcriptional repressor) of toxin-antitoxin stability system
MVSTGEKLMTTQTQQRISLDEAQSMLADLVHRLNAGDEVIITEGQRTVARLLPALSATTRPRRAGSAKGRLKVLIEDEEHLRDFEDYMP